MIPSLNTSFYCPVTPKSRWNTFVKKTKYTVSLIFNRIMNFFCRRKWWHSIEGLKDRNIRVGALPLRRRLFRNDLSRLKAQGVESILSLVEPFEYKRGIAGNPVTPEDLKNGGIEFLLLPTPDFKVLPLDTLLAAAAYIDKITKTGKKILVHCKAGRGRSVAAVCSYLMIHQSKSADEAIEYVRKFRPHISMRFKQRAVLIELQDQLQRNRTLLN